ncbi:MAG: DMT family transporter [Deltaproteobacteria bacterium]|nr:DMT family transporter [Deltaproteobacteria bacterium]MBN2671198.1 DMT family transporter [Deltaproteobacteria bacterium]
MNGQLKGALYVLAAMFAFSLMSTLVKSVSNEVSSVQSVFARGLVGVIWVFFLARRRKVSLLGNRKGLLLLRALAGTIALVMVFYAFTQIPTANAMLLNQAVPLFMVPLAVIFLKERTSYLHVTIVLVALCGAALVLKPDMKEFRLPGFLALFSAFFAAIAYLSVRKLNETEHPLTIVFWFVTISTVAVIPLMWGQPIRPSFWAGIQVLGVGILGTVGQVFLTIGYKYGEAGRLAVIGSTGAVFCALWDYLVWDHVPDAWTALGGMLVISSCSVIQFMRHQAAKQSTG